MLRKGKVVTVVGGIKTAVDGKMIKSYPQKHGLSYELADAVVRDVHKLPFHRTCKEDGVHCYVVRHGHFASQDDKAVNKIVKETEAGITSLLSKVSDFFKGLVKYNTEMCEYQIVLSGVPELGASPRETIRRRISQIDGIGSAHHFGGNLSASPSGDASEADPGVVNTMQNILKAELPHAAIVAAMLAP
jgi:hypothetical protein